ncbi:MAG: ornithine--oxo-acid transaminase [Candidatus Thermoplasmatota archaeon]
MKASEYMELELAYGAHNYEPLPVVISKAKGVWVWDVDGKKYLDMLSCYSAMSQGHIHPYIINAAKKQLEKLTLTSRAFFNDRLGIFLKHLCKLASMEMALPMNTGAEAVETAIKLARKYAYKKRGLPNGKAEIIVCENNFHGRTTTIVGFSSDKLTYDCYGPFTPGFIKIPYNDINAFKKAITNNTIGLLIEPIQAEAGVIVPDEGYLKKLRDICTEHNILLMLDEIQTGLGRTGKLFAFEHEGIRPDILILGKALGGGIVPISAVLSSKEIMSVFTPGTHGSTFGGNPLACAIGDAALDVIVNEKLAERAREIGEYFMKKLRTIKSKKIKEIRGKGLLIGVEMHVKKNENVRPLCEKLLRAGVLAKDTHEKTIRLAPPLIITKDEIDWAFGRIRKVLEG